MRKIGVRPPLQRLYSSVPRIFVPAIARRIESLRAKVKDEFVRVQAVGINPADPL